MGSAGRPMQPVLHVLLAVLALLVLYCSREMSRSTTPCRVLGAKSLAVAIVRHSTRCRAGMKGRGQGQGGRGDIRSRCMY
jgi:hypothetical protein